MKQKLALCCALIHRPKVLLLDEPTTGVDPVSRKEFWDILGRLKSQGITILVATPYMDEAARCDQIALMHKGRILESAPPAAIIAAWKRPLIAIRSGAPHSLLHALRRQPWTHSVYSFGYALHLTLTHLMKPSEITDILYAEGFNDLEVEKIEPSIEDCFMELIRTPEFPAPE
jgi:ABC-type multidrug transport system ATPase subunit